MMAECYMHWKWCSAWKRHPLNMTAGGYSVWHLIDISPPIPSPLTIGFLKTSIFIPPGISIQTSDNLDYFLHWQARICHTNSFQLRNEIWKWHTRIKNKNQYTDLWCIIVLQQRWEKYLLSREQENQIGQRKKCVPWLYFVQIRSTFHLLLVL